MIICGRFFQIGPRPAPITLLIAHQAELGHGVTPLPGRLPGRLGNVVNPCAKKKDEMYFVTSQGSHSCALNLTHKYVCCCSFAKLCPTLCNPMVCSMPGFPILTISWNLLKFMSTESMMPSNHLIFCHPLLLLPSIFPSIRVFSNELALPIMWLKYWRCSFSISPSNEYSGLISFRIDWFDLLALQGSLKSLLQHPTIQKHQFFDTQPSLWSNSHIHT